MSLKLSMLFQYDTKQVMHAISPHDTKQSMHGMSPPFLPCTRAEFEPRLPQPGHWVPQSPSVQQDVGGRAWLSQPTSPPGHVCASSSEVFISVAPEAGRLASRRSQLQEYKFSFGLMRQVRVPTDLASRATNCAANSLELLFNTSSRKMLLLESAL